MSFYYGAGGFYDEWRKRIARECDIIVQDPRLNPQNAAYRFITADFGVIAYEDCIGVIAHISPPPIRCSGTSAEIGYAAAIGKPVFLIVEEAVPDMFLVGCARRIFFGLDAFIAWFNDRKEKGLPIL